MLDMLFQGLEKKKYQDVMKIYEEQPIQDISQDIVPKCLKNCRSMLNQMAWPNTENSQEECWTYCIKKYIVGLEDIKGNNFFLLPVWFCVDIGVVQFWCGVYWTHLKQAFCQGAPQCIGTAEIKCTVEASDTQHTLGHCIHSSSNFLRV